MDKSSLAPIILVTVLASIGGVLFLSLETKPKPATPTVAQTQLLKEEAIPATKPAPAAGPVAGFREYPIGDPQGVEKNHIRVAAVWLPSVTMEGDKAPGGAIHVEADITATENNPNGFASGEFVPYLTITYKLTTPDGKTVLDQGKLLPMVARDGLHYGTSMVPPKPGTYKLTYEIQPPSTGGLGRHHDPATGVGPWWEPFKVDFEWEYEGETKSSMP